MIIAPPRLSAEHPDRLLECQFVAQPVFQALTRQMHAAGWSESEVAGALLDLALNHMKGMIANGELLPLSAAAELAIIADNRNIEADDIEGSESDDVVRTPGRRSDALL